MGGLFICCTPGGSDFWDCLMFKNLQIGRLLKSGARCFGRFGFSKTATGAHGMRNQMPRWRQNSQARG